MSWNLRKGPWETIETVMQVLTSKFGRDIICLFTEVDFWPEHPVLEGWEFRHAADSKVAVAWPAALAGNLSSKYVSRLHAGGLLIGSLGVCCGYLCDSWKPQEMFEESVKQLKEVRVQLLAMGAKHFVVGGDFNTHLPNHVPGMTEGRAGYSWSNSAVSRDRQELLLKTAEHDFRCRFGSADGEEAPLRQIRTFSANGVDQVLDHWMVPKLWKCRYTCMNKEIIKIGEAHKDHFPLAYILPQQLHP